MEEAAGAEELEAEEAVDEELEDEAEELDEVLVLEMEVTMEETADMEELEELAEPGELEAPGEPEEPGEAHLEEGRLETEPHLETELRPSDLRHPSLLSPSTSRACSQHNGSPNTRTAREPMGGLRMLSDSLLCTTHSSKTSRRRCGLLQQPQPPTRPSEQPSWTAS